MRTPPVVAAALLLAFLPGLAGAHPGVGIVRDSRGNVYYTDLAQVWKISPSGDRSIAVRRVHTHELYLDSLDNLYGEHLWYEGDATGRWGHRVWRLSPDGRIVDVLPTRQGFRDDHDEFHFDWDRHGRMYWADRGPTTAIRCRDASGRISTLVEGIRDAGRFIVTHDGQLYYMTGGDLCRRESDGTSTTLARNLKERRASERPMGDSHHIMGLWTDDGGGVYLAVLGGRLVKRVATDGTVAVVARSEEPWAPTGGLLDPRGDLWLLETSDDNAVRVRRMRGGNPVATYGP